MWVRLAGQQLGRTFVNALCMLAEFYDLSERADDAQHAMDEAVEIASRYGDGAQRALVQLNVASTALARGEFSRTLALLLAVRDELAGHGGMVSLTSCLTSWAMRKACGSFSEFSRFISFRWLQ